MTYKSIDELKKMSLEEVVEYVDCLEKTDETAKNNGPEYQEWCGNELDERLNKVDLKEWLNDLQNARQEALQFKNVAQERLRDALLDACPDAEPAMVEIHGENVYFYGTILQEKDDDEEVNINRYGLTYSENVPQIGDNELLNIAKRIIKESGLF